MTHTKFTALGLTAMLVLAVFASVPVAAQTESVAVQTEAPTAVSTDEATLQGNLTQLENASEATVWFEYWEQGDPANATESATSLTVIDTGPFAIDVSDLESNTTYVAQAHAETTNASAVGSNVTFTTDEVESVAVATENATDVTDDAATLNGELTELSGADNATVWFEYWEAGDRANNSTTTSLTLDAPAAFSASIDGLAHNTTYAYVAHAATENESATGDQVEFTTDTGDAVAVSTEDPTDLTNASATLNGELTELEGDTNATVWFEYWPQGDRANTTNTTVQTLDGPGAFSASVDNLSAETTYFVKAHAETENESASGGAVTFTTLPDQQPLGVETHAASDVTNTSATLNGELTGLSGEDNATVWFEYWVEGDRANTSNITADQILDAPGSFNASVSDLDNDTTYVYVAHASANGSNVTGEEVEFTATDGADEEFTWDGEGPFGRWVSQMVDKLKSMGLDGPLGQHVSAIVTENNPGADNRSENANPGGNGNGPPAHAANNSDNGNGPPAHAANNSDNGGGPPEHANNDKGGNGPSSTGDDGGDGEDDEDEEDGSDD